MPLFNCPFAPRRMTLVAATPTDVIPPFTCSSVTISNRTTGDLKVSADPTSTNYFIISSCFEERLDLPQVGPDVRVYRGGDVNFTLEAVDGGEVVLLWM